MEKFDPQIKPVAIDDQTQQKQRGADVLDQAPQPALTAPNNTDIGTLTSPENAILQVDRTRLLEIENALVRIGIIKSR